MEGPHRRPLVRPGKASGDNCRKTHWVWSALEASEGKQQVGTAACNSSLRPSCCPDRQGLSGPAERRRQLEPCKCSLSQRQDHPKQLLRAGSSTRMSQEGPSALMQAPQMLPCILDVKLAAASRQAWFESSTETKTMLYFRRNPASLQNTSRFGVQMWGFALV